MQKVTASISQPDDDATSPDTPATLRVGIAGFGNQGAIYARLLNEGRVDGMRLAAVSTRAQSKAAAIREAGARHFNDYREMLHSGEIDVVVITTPHHLHPEMATAALEAGIHTVLDKPAGIRPSDVTALNAVAEAHPELTFAMLFNNRANPLFQRVRDLVTSGELGSLRYTSWIVTHWWRPQAYFDQSAWRATWEGEGGGLLVNQAPHNLDLWQWICGMPERVFAKVGCGTHRDIAVDDQVHAIVDFGEGVTGHLLSATHDPAGTDRLEILCDAGKVVVTGSKDVTVYRFWKPEAELSATATADDVTRLTTGQFDSAELYSVETERFESAWGVQHADLLSDVASAILRGTPLLAPGVEGLNGVRLAAAMYLSGWTGREVVVDEVDAEYDVELDSRIAEERAGAPVA